MKRSQENINTVNTYLLKQYLKASLTLFSTLGTVLFFDNFFKAVSAASSSSQFLGTGVANKIAAVEVFEKGRFNTPGIAYDVHLVNKLAYMADASAGIEIVDVTNEATPALLGSYNTTGFARQIDIFNNYLSVAADTAGLKILDVTSPASIQLVATYNLSQPVTRLVAANGNAFIANNNEAVFDVVKIGANPSSVIGTTYQVGRSITDFYNIGNTVLINHLGLGVTVADATSLPKYIHFSLTGICKGITTSGSYAYVAADAAGIYIIDINQPNNPQVIGTYDTPGNAQGVFMDGSRLYVADGSAGLHILDVNSKSSPQLLGTFDTAGDAKNVFVLANIAYVADASAGLALIEITDPRNLRLYTEFKTSGIVEDVYVVPRITQDVTAQNDQIVYVADGPNGLDVLYVKNRGNVSVEFFGNYDSAGYTYGVFMQNSLVSIADNNQGLGIIDVSDPNNPRLFGSYVTPNATDVVMAGNTVYMTDLKNGLYVFDIASVSYPKLLGLFDTPGSATAFSYSGTRIFVADGNQGMQIIDAPFWQGRLPKPTTVIQVAGNSDHAYVTTVEKTLQIIDIRDRANPLKGSLYNLTSSSRDIDVASAYVYVTEGKFGVEIIDVNDHENPRRAAQYNLTLSNARGIEVVGNRLYVADDAAGLVILQTNVQPLITSNQMIIYRGQTKLMTFDNLDAYDPDNLPTEVIFTVSNVQGGYFQLATAPGNPTTTFTLNDRQQNQVQFVQDGTTTAPNYNLQVSDGRLTEGPYSPLVIFDQRPVWINNKIDIIQGSNVILTLANLDASVAPSMTIPYDFNSVTFYVNSTQNGQFENPLQPGIAITNFTKQNIVEGHVEFVSANSYFAAQPSYSLSVSNGAYVDGPQEAMVNFTRKNQPPKFENFTILVNEGQVVTINLLDLRAIDDFNNNTLQFDISIMGNGRFEIPNVTYSNITNLTTVDENIIMIAARFLQQDIGNGHISFRHTGGSFDKPFYNISVTDSDGLGTGFINGSVNFNASPKLLQNQLSIDKGATIVITESELQAIDVDDDNSTLKFEISNITHGSFQRINQTSNITVIEFQQVDIAARFIKFIHDNSTEAPSYSVAVRDKRMTTANESAKVAFNDPTQQISQDTASIAGPVAGGVSVAALAVAGFFVGRVYYVDRQTRKPHGFADDIYQELKLNSVRNFKNANGRRFVSAVGKLMAEFKTFNIDVPNMTRSQQQILAKDVAAEARNKITADATCGSSDITIDDFEGKVKEIATAVAQNRGALNTNTYEAVSSSRW